MQYFLRIDYILSSWFSKTQDKIIPGTAFIFLNKVAFIWATLFFSITGALKIDISTQTYVAILVLGGVIIMYGFQKKVERLVQKLEFEKSLKTLSQVEIVKIRLMGLLYFTTSFIIIFISVSIFNR